jgi:hypothetical protein
MYALNPPNQTSAHVPEGSLMVYRPNVIKEAVIGEVRALFEIKLVS